MSTEIKIKRRVKGGDPVMVITVTGTHDFYRFADMLTRAQCDFADIGRRAQDYLKGSYGTAWVARANDYFYGKGVR